MLFHELIFIFIFSYFYLLLHAVRIRTVLIMRTATDVQNGVRLVGTIESEEGIEVGICLDVDKHAGGP